LVTVFGAAAVATRAAAEPGPVVIRTISQCCTYDHNAFEPYFMEAGNLARFHPNVGERHNVTARELGPDGKPLFSTPTLLGGDEAPIAGTQYLQEGAFAFYCTIHGFNVMHGSLNIVGGGPGAVPRPTVGVEIVSRRLRQVRRSGLNVTVRPSEASGGIVLTATRAGIVLAQQTRIAAGAGELRSLTLPLTAAGRRALRGRVRAIVRLNGALPYSQLGSTARLLR
jgi:plastocyanin